MSNFIQTSVNNGILEITLNRPDKKNALTNAMYADMVSALMSAKTDDDIKVVLFSAVGDYFSAGNDLADFLAIARDGGDFEKAQGVAFIRTLSDYPKPIVCAVTGAGVGIGTTLLLHADLVYVQKSARLSTPFVNLALVPEASSSLLLTERIGHVRAFEMLVMGESITGQTAHEWGLANACFETADEVLATARQKAQHLAKLPAIALLQTKALMKNTNAIQAKMEQELVLFNERLKSDEARAVFAQFFNKQ
ncbi:MAG: enoyl-CoA hydratase-related protein [Moraxella sp.]|uniref:enoyl-CoA hydratase-related protein n=1 Tax=Moraxella sp. TaxID=479 RepID=UPI0026DC3136|nr:enoyl-CoA hydratase-related protein [Moraxella sp.]MDO4450855.1 enoyl-CoA hydratase-related protein [Moraxella sp.]